MLRTPVIIVHKRFATRLCPVCGSAKSKLLFRQSFEPFSAASLMDGYDVVICQSVYHHFVDKQLFWEQFCKLRPHCFVLENPIDDEKYLLTASWQQEKDYLQSLGYEAVWESYDNDFASRILALFERIDH